MVNNPFGTLTFGEQDDTDTWPYDSNSPAVPIKKDEHNLYTLAQAAQYR